MSDTPIYTIGHGTRPAAELLRLLQQYGVRYLVDVRSRPYSGYNPQYNRPALQAYLQANSITYVYMGDALGGRPDDPECYDDEGKVDYEVVREEEFFRAGLYRIKTAYERQVPIALLCSESKPCNCHRSRLIGEMLAQWALPVQHITETGGLEDQKTVMEMLRK